MIIYDGNGEIEDESNGDVTPADDAGGNDEGKRSVASQSAHVFGREDENGE